MIARSILIEGHVQGVFFREWTVGKARELGVSGWVRNRRDGRVEVFVVGKALSVERFIACLHEGSPPSRVDAVHVEDAEVQPIEGFSRRQTV
jgi:acylphosphatase